ncbi:MAG: hypothetical protein JO144_01965, partial [Actinobacteria bacterium]|nr:hypothetical protein [Actinomycetota bacterium]
MAGYRSTTAAASLLLAAALAITGCSQKKVPGQAAGGPTTGASHSAAASPSASRTPAATVRFNPADHTAEVNPVTPVKVAVTGGSLSTVSLTNAEGK